MSKRLGAVIVFKDDVIKEQAESWMASIMHVLDVDRCQGLVEYDDGHGDPVWYVP